jgi:penicillin amidase
MQPFVNLGRARTEADVLDAVRGFGSPAQNFVYATTEGRGGYRLIGRVPLRPSGEPALPRDGTTSASDWTGEVAADAMPAFAVAHDGHVVTANNAHARNPPVYFSNLYEPAWRAQRIRELLAGRAGLSCEDMVAIQRDAHSLQAETFRRLVVLPSTDAIRATRPPAAPMLDCLLAVTGDESTNAVGPALLHFTYYHLARRVFGAAVPEELVHRWMACINVMDAPLLAALTDPDTPWATPAVRATLLGEAMEDAAKDLAARGLSIHARWGEVHRLTLRHPLSAAPGIGAAFTRGPYEMPGGPFTPDSGMYFHHQPAAMVVGASFRHVVDMADPERTARMVIFGGQSGHVGSRHYDDLTPIWRAGEFVPSRLERWPERGRDLRLLPA